MKWTSHPHGTRRERRPFAWLPVRTSDFTLVWLERYLVVEEWTHIGHQAVWVEVFTRPLGAKP